jgi:hypothetical protein
MLFLSTLWKCYNHRSVSQLGYRHLRPITPPASTLGETSPASRVLPKGSVVRVFVGAMLKR